MRTTSCFVGLVAWVLPACGSPAAPSPTLDGNWHTAYNPGGGYIALSLATAGTAVSGTFAVYGLESRPAGHGTITGEFVNRWFGLTFAYSDGAIATYAGRLVSANQLQGTWTSPASASASQSTSDLTFYRP